MHLSALPNSLGPSLSRVDWMPIDVLTKAIIEVCVKVISDITSPTCSRSTKLEVYHFSNPRPSTWNLLLPTYNYVRLELGVWRFC